MSFFRGFSIAMGANAVLFVLTFLNKKLLYVLFSKSDNGLYVLVLNYAMLLALIVGEWLRLTNMNLAGKESDSTPSLSANVIYYTLITGLFLLVPLLFMIQGKDELFGLPVFYLLLALGIGLCLILRNSFQSFLLVHKQTMIYGITFIVWGSLIFGLNIILLYVFKLDISFAVISLLLASFAAALLALVASWVLNGIALKPSLRLFRQSGHLGWKSAVAVAGMFFMIRAHIFAIERFAGDRKAALAMVGLFSIGFSVYQLLQRGSDVAGSVLYAHIAGGERKGGFILTAGVCRNMLWLLVLACAVAGLTGKLMIYIIADSTYFDAYIPLILMLPGMAFMNTGTVINSSYWGRGYPFYIIFAPFAAGGLGLLLDFYLVPLYGAAGASFSFAAVSIIWFVYLVYVFKKDSGLPLKDILLPRWSELVQILYRTRVLKAPDNVS